MKINSKNLFRTLLEQDKRLDDREKRLNKRSVKLSTTNLMSVQSEQINPQEFFTMGFMKGFELGMKASRKQTEGEGKNQWWDFLDVFPNSREMGGPVKKGETYLVGEKGPEYVTPTENAYVSPNEVVASVPTALNKSNIRTVVQPVISTKVMKQKIVQPVPISSKSSTVQIMTVDKLPSSIAKMIS